MASQGFYNWTTATEGATAVVLVVGAIATCIGIVFKGASNSRCEDVSVCCGLVKCHRQPKIETDLENQSSVKKENIDIVERP